MFDNLKNLGSVAGLLKDMPRIKAKMEEMKVRLGEMTVEAETGGGAVRCTANGLLQVVKIEVDQVLMTGIVDASDPDDKAMAQDLITGAVNAALVRARELSQNSRSGLTVRFLSKKLELPQEEIEYLVDVNHKLLYTDLTKIKLPAEGVNAVKRISEGLENLGDIPALFRKIKSLSVHDFRLLEEQLGLMARGRLRRDRS